MKNNIVKGVLTGCIISMAIACNSNQEGSTTAAEKEQIKKEIQAKEDEFANIYNTGVLKDIGYYADSAVVFYQNRKPIVGNKAIVEFLTSDLGSNTNKISFTTNEVFPSNDGNQVVEVGSYKVVDSANYLVNSGNYIILFEKRNGKYESVREMSASDLPVQ